VKLVAKPTPSFSYGAIAEPIATAMSALAYAIAARREATISSLNQPRKSEVSSEYSHLMAIAGDALCDARHLKRLASEAADDRFTDEFFPHLFQCLVKLQTLAGLFCHADGIMIE
jgi:hypothetical protein